MTDLQLTQFSTHEELIEAKLSARDHSRRAKRNKNISKTPDRLWSMLHGKNGDKDKFLKIEAIQEENTNSDIESVCTSTTSTKPSFNLQLPKIYRSVARPQESLNKDLLDANIDFDKVRKVRKVSMSPTKKTSRMDRDRLTKPIHQKYLNSIKTTSRLSIDLLPTSTATNSELQVQQSNSESNTSVSQDFEKNEFKNEQNQMVNVSEMSSVSHAMFLLNQIKTQQLNINVQAIIMEKNKYNSTIVANFFNQIGKQMNIVAVSLGDSTTNLRDDIHLLKKCPHIVVGMPDRVGLLIKKGHLRSHEVKCISINKSTPRNTYQCKQEYHLIKL